MEWQCAVTQLGSQDSHPISLVSITASGESNTAQKLPWSENYYWTARLGCPTKTSNSCSVLYCMSKRRERYVFSLFLPALHLLLDMLSHHTHTVTLHSKFYVCESLLTLTNRRVCQTDRQTQGQSDTTRRRVDLLVTCVSFYLKMCVCFDKVYY